MLTRSDDRAHVLKSIDDLWQAETRMIWEDLAEELWVQIPAGTAVSVNLDDLPDGDPTWEQLVLDTYDRPRVPNQLLYWPPRPER